MPLAEQPISRCKWATDVTEEERLYHDNEWGVPLYDDNKLFELLILEGAQAGLSWKTILLKRESYRELFAAFDPVKVAAFSDAHCAALCQDARIIRHHGKIKGAVTNAKAFLAVQAEFGSFAKYIWQFAVLEESAPLQTESTASRAMAKDLRKRHFTFVGPTICYAFMQATGMINDHTPRCFRYKELMVK